MKWSGGRNGAGWHVNPVRPYYTIHTLLGHTLAILALAILAAQLLLLPLTTYSFLTTDPYYLLGAARG
eukprot:scaffold47182_cov57-Phaeocystis_antarctica.AAC.6